MSAATLDLVEGREIRRPLRVVTDVVVVGSGPAGAAVARTVARGGAQVVVLEEGPFVAPEDYAADGFAAMARLYRDLGATLSLGRPMMPMVQGRVVGGTSVVNGAISWRLPRDVHDEWVAADPALGEALPWTELGALHDAVEDDLDIHPTPPDVAGANNLLLKKGADALGLDNRPIWRNVRACRGLGQCLQGCPEGNKRSMDVAYLPEACEAGARVYSDVRVDRLEVERGRAAGVRGQAAGGGEVTVTARRAVVLAASAVQTPVLLLRSGVTSGPLGRGFQCHPGVSVTGRFDDPVRLWTGATQGHEVIGLRREGIKFEALGYDMTLVATRVKGYGRALSRGMEELAYLAQWGAAIRAIARGRVSLRLGQPVVEYSLGPFDLHRVRRGVRVLAEMMLAAGARHVDLGLHGYPGRVSDPGQLSDLEEHGPRDPGAFQMAATHLFGTCRMGSDPRRAVVRPDFRHHAVDRLYVADSSVFPSNTGVNPQTSIIALATLCGRRVVSEGPC